MRRVRLQIFELKEFSWKDDEVRRVYSDGDKHQTAVALLVEVLLQIVSPASKDTDTGLWLQR